MNHDDVRRLLQERYCDNLDNNNPEAAVMALHPDVVWSHLPSWAGAGLSATDPDVIVGRDRVLQFLKGAIGPSIEAGVIHTVVEFATDGTDGALVGSTTSTKSDLSSRFMSWFTVRDGLIAKYATQPI